MAPAEVVEHVFVARMCALCRKRRMSQDSLQGLAMGRRRLGANLVSLIVTLREEGRLPVRSIQWYLRTVHQLKLSVGAIVGAVHAAARKAQPAVAATLERIRGSPVVHADETGWRQDGANGYVWTFSTPTDRYFVRRGRGKGVGDEVLGESFSGVLVSDFYAAYNRYPGLKQRCWAHLLRDIRELEALYPKTPACPGGPNRCGGSTAGPRPGRCWRPAAGWSSRGDCCRCVVPSRMTRWRRRPSSAVA